VRHPTYHETTTDQVQRIENEAKTKSLQFRRVEESESDNLFHDHIQGEDENAEDVQMADHLRPMEELLQIPIVGIEDAIVVPAVLANESELKIELLDFISNNPFFGLDNDDPHSHIRRFYQITRTLKLNQVPHDVVKLILFPNKPQVSSSGGTSTQIDAITALTKQVEALEYHIASTRETYDHNQEGAIQLMQNQMGQMEEALQEIPLEKKQEPETITEVVEIPSSQSTPLVPPPETPPLSNLEPNPHQPSIPYPSWLQEENFQALENLMGRADHFVYRIDIVDSLCDKFPIPNNQSSGSTTSHFDFSLPDYEVFYFDVDHQEEKSSGSTTSHSNLSFPSYESFFFDIDHQEKKSSGSTTSQSDHSLPDYEAFCFDHQEDKRSGSTASHSDLFLLEYESFYFNLSIDPLPPAEMSDSHQDELADELAHIISPPEYDRFYFDIEVDPRELNRLLKKNISET
ncbi:hypothetical protein Tco_1296842, partial [Tanacetum coccineum]